MLLCCICQFELIGVECGCVVFVSLSLLELNVAVLYLSV